MGLPTKAQIRKAMQWEGFQSLTMNGDAPSSDSERLTVSFFNSSRNFFDGEYSAFWGWSAAEKAAVREVLDQIETFLNVEFSILGDGRQADIELGIDNLSGSTIGLGGYRYYGSYEGFALFDYTYDIVNDPEAVILHEIAHAMGLRHPFDTDILKGDYESNKYTVISYTYNPDTDSISQGAGLFDVYALQDIWGEARYKGGDTTYTGPGGVSTRTIWDTGGSDTFSAAGKNAGVKFDLREGMFSQFRGYDDVVIALGTEIENAFGSKKGDVIMGNDLGNVLDGGQGNDRITAKDGADSVNGGAGGDVIKGQGGSDELSGGGGADKIWGGDDHDTLNGGDGNDTLKGDDGRDTLDGGGGDDELRGGKGADRLDGGAGDDHLYGGADSAQDVFVYEKGKDKVWGYVDGIDKLDVLNHGDAASILALAEAKGSGTKFDFGGGHVLIVKDVDPSAFDTGDFL